MQSMLPGLVRQIETPEREILSFLTKAWSENKHAQFHWAGTFGFHANTENQQVYISQIRDQTNYPKLKGFDRWRFWRFMTFHESQHLLFSPKGTPKEAVEELCREGKRYNIMVDIFQIIEDYRIEKLGLETYIGYIPEKDWTRAYTYALTQKTFKHEAQATNPFKLWFLEFLVRVLWNKKLKLISKNLEKDTQVFVDRAHEVRNPRGVATLVDDIMDWLIKTFPARTLYFNDRAFYITHSSDQDQSPTVVIVAKAVRAGDSVTKKEVKKALKGLGMTKKQADQAVKGSKVAQLEFKQIQEQKEKSKQTSDPAMTLITHLGHDAPNNCNAYPKIPHVASEYWEDLISPVESLLSQLKSRLRRWKVGWKENLDYSGDNLDIEGMVISKLRDDKIRNNKIFYDEEKLSSKGKIAILIDMSSSIGSSERTYLQAGGLIAEALTFIKTRFELYCFNSGNAANGTRNILWIVKAMNERWGVEQKERLANMHNAGGTPLHNVMRLIRSRVKKQNINRLVIITDGSPNDLDAAKTEVSKLTRDGVKVMFLGVLNARLDNMKNILDHKTPSRAKLIESLDLLPSAFFDLLQASL